MSGAKSWVSRKVVGSAFCSGRTDREEPRSRRRGPALLVIEPVQIVRRSGEEVGGSVDPRAVGRFNFVLICVLTVVGDRIP